MTGCEALGAARVGGRPVPEAGRQGAGCLLMPAGRKPAFIVTPNLRVLRDRNVSDLHALFVGHAGDRIARGAGGFAAVWATPEGGLGRAEVAAVQRALMALGHDTDGANGLARFRTRRAIGR